MKFRITALLILLALPLLLMASETWTQIGCAVSATNWSTAASWKCTSGTGCTSTCGLGDGTNLYPQASGDTATIGAWITTDDVSTLTLGDPANVTTSAITPVTGATFTMSGKTLNLVGGGLIIPNTVTNAKFHFDGAFTVNCTSGGNNTQANPTYCANLGGASATGTNTIEFCGNSACGVPTPDSQGYAGFGLCPTVGVINGDGTNLTGMKGGNVTSATQTLLWTTKCVQFKNMSWPTAQTTDIFTSVDMDDVEWGPNMGGLWANPQGSPCADVIHSIQHVDIRSSILTGAQFLIEMTGCTSVTHATQPNRIRFITEDNYNSGLQWLVGSYLYPLQIDHIVHGSVLSHVNNSLQVTVSNLAFVPVNPTIYSGWGNVGINTGYANNTWNNILVAGSASSGTLSSNSMFDEDGTSIPPPSQGGPNKYTNWFVDGWNANSGKGTYLGGISVECQAYMNNIVAFNGAGRIAQTAFGYNPLGSITAITASGGNISVTMRAIQAGAGFAVGHTVTLNGTGVVGWDGNSFTIATSNKTTTFTLTASGITNSASAGTAVDAAIDYPGCVQFNNFPQANVGAVANFNTFYAVTAAGAVGVPGPIAITNNTASYQPYFLTSDRFNDIAGNLFVNIPAGVTTIGKASYNLQGWLRQAEFTFDYNNYFNITGITGNYKTPSGGNTYLSGPFSCLSSTCTTIGTLGTSLQSTQTAPPGTTGCAGGTTQCGPFHLTSTPTGFQNGDILCDGTLSTSWPNLPCGIITAISGNDVTVGGQSLFTTTGSLGVGKTVAPVQGDTLTLIQKYTTDTNPDYAQTAGRGGSDSALNPQFTDPTCTVASWDTSIGGAGTAADVNAGMVAMNGVALNGTVTTFNPSYKIENVLAYLTRCWTPVNLALKNTVTDSTRCAQNANSASAAGQCDPGALPISVGAILNQ